AASLERALVAAADRDFPKTARPVPLLSDDAAVAPRVEPRVDAASPGGSHRDKEGDVVAVMRVLALPLSLLVHVEPAPSDSTADAGDAEPARRLDGAAPTPPPESRGADDDDAAASAELERRRAVLGARLRAALEAHDAKFEAAFGLQAKGYSSQEVDMARAAVG